VVVILGLLTTEALMLALLPFGGKTLDGLVDSYPELIALATGSTHEEVAAMTSCFTGPEATKLVGTYPTAKRIKADVIDALGEDLATHIVDSLNGAQIKEMLTDLGAAQVKLLAGTGKNHRGAAVHRNRVTLAAIGRKLAKPEDLAIYWTGIKIDLLEKLWKGKEAEGARLATLLKDVGVEALKSLLPSMTQAELFDHASRLEDKGLKGFGEAMSGSDLKSVTAVGGDAAPADLLLKELGKSHAATLKSATKHFASMPTMNLVLRKCAAHLDAAATASFLADAVRYRWKQDGPLTEFFTLAGADIVRLVNLAKEFANEDNAGARPEAAGAGNPSAPSASATYKGSLWKAAVGDINHFMAGHSFVAFAMTDNNAGRADSTMWPTGTARNQIITDAQTVLDAPAFKVFAEAVPAPTGYVYRTIAGFDVGVDCGLRRITQMYPTGGRRILRADMRAAAKLFQSKP
jgi:hypothetical protein